MDVDVDEYDDKIGGVMTIEEVENEERLEEQLRVFGSLVEALAKDIEDNGDDILH